MKTAKSILNIIDDELIRLNNEWSRTDDTLAFNGFCAVLRVAEKTHGCRLRVSKNAVYELRKVYSRVSVMHKDEVEIDE